MPTRTPPPPQYVRVMLSMPEPLWEQLQEQARRELRSVKSEAVRLIRDGLADGNGKRRRR